MGVPCYDDELFVPRVNESLTYYLSLMIQCDYKKNEINLTYFRNLWEHENQYEERLAIKKNH